MAGELYARRFSSDGGKEWAGLHPDHEINRASWDELAATHGQDAYYDSEALIAGASSLIQEEEAALAAPRQG
jgi:hypothetical protein